MSSVWNWQAKTTAIQREVYASVRCGCLRFAKLISFQSPPLSWIMASEEVIEEVEALTAILEEDTVEVVKEEGGERPKVNWRRCCWNWNLSPRNWASRYFPWQRGSRRSNMCLSILLSPCQKVQQIMYKSLHLSVVLFWCTFKYYISQVYSFNILTSPSLPQPKRKKSQF